MALLLWGTRMVRTGFERAYGADLRRAIRAGTKNRLRAFLAGFGVAALLQSSIATAMMTAGFAGRRLLSTAAALAVMLGADLGTTVAAQVLSFDLGWLSPLLLLGGVIGFLSTSRVQPRNLGRVGIGLGLMLLALGLIVSASAPAREAAILREVVGALAGEPLLAVLLVGLLTWLTHSSLAVVLLVMTLATAGLVPPPFAFVLVLGANLGGAVPPVLMTAGQLPSARRVPIGNLLIRAVGVAAALPLVGLAAPYLAAFDPDPARQVVNFHTAFNLGLAALFLGLTGPIAVLLARLLPDRDAALDPAQPRYLDKATLDEPTVALACAEREALRMGDMVEAMLVRTGEVLHTDDRDLQREIERMDDVVDRLNHAIKLFLTEVSRRPLDPEQSRRCVEIIGFTTNLEHIGDIIEKSLLELAAKKIRHKLAFSEQGLEEIEQLHQRVLEHLRLGFSVFISGDLDTARRLLEEKTRFREQDRAAADSHLARLRLGRADSIETSALHLDILRDLKRIHSHIAAAAYPILEEAGELRPTRLRRASSGTAGPPGDGRP